VTDPALATLLREAVPFSLPLRRQFRGAIHREGLLIRGPSGWGEFSPFPDYSDAASARWLAAAVEASYGSWPDPLRTSVPVNAIIPAVPADDAAALTREAVLERGCTTIKVKVAEVGQTRLDDEARVAAVRVLRHVCVCGTCAAVCRTCAAACVTPPGTRAPPCST
jgi:O-succinylbenzoate synthase